MNLPATQLAHSFCPATGCTVPGLHTLCASEPVEQEEPTGHAVHWPLLPRPDASLNVPSAHGSGALLPSSQYEPASQSKHAVCPLSFMNLPATHSAHSFWPSSGCTVPGLHSLWISEPVEHEEPSGHDVHWLSLPSPGALLYEPSLHGNGALLPSSQ